MVPSTSNIGLQGKMGQQIGDELIAKILGLLSPADLARAEASCTHWRGVSREYGLWTAHLTRLTAAIAEHRQAAVNAASEQPADARQASAHNTSRSASAACAAGTAESSDGCPGGTESCKRRYTELQMAQRWRHGRTQSRYLAGHTGAVTACSAWGGRWLASGSADQTVRIWDLASGITCATLRHGAPVSALSMLGPSTVAAGSGPGMYLWRGGRCVRKYSVEGRRAAVRQLAVLDSALATASGDSLVPVWDLYSGSLQRMLRPHEATAVNCLLATELGSQQVLISGDSQGRVVLTDLEGSSPLAELSMHDFLGMASADLLAMTPDGRRLLAAGSRGEVMSWDLRMLGGRPGFAGQVLIRRPHRTLVSAMSVPEYGADVFALAGPDGHLCLHDLHSGRLLRSIQRLGKSSVLSLAGVANGWVGGRADHGLVLWQFGGWQ
ncbi:hypothetical protein WJX72_003569 [[Myrmecia] bisecta]|uniref:F-box domain-containing protein n=1 Tax=[Myrmecia] bisecta TaxID=41462 RepID=A0AAW1P8K9_9CHLO